MIGVLALLWGCANNDLDGDGLVGADDCNDLDASVPAQAELCNGRDDDCNGLIDDAPTDGLVGFVDSDGDGYGDPDEPTTGCSLGSGVVADDSDCDDSAANTHPRAAERCDGADNDCDEVVDEDAIDANVWFVDGDGDGFGVEGSVLRDCSTTAPSGHSAVAGDCNDFDPDFAPDATEICANGTDEDCDGEADEAQGTWFTDGDSDGYGDAAAPVDACSQPAGAVDDATDCDDSAAGVHPTAPETCDGVDQDCNGITDDQPVDGVDYYRDNDGDGFGQAATDAFCQLPVLYAIAPGDCDDTDAAVNPGAPEVCGNQVDDDCDGTAQGCRLDYAAVATDDLPFAEGVDGHGTILGRYLEAADLDGDGAVDLAACAYGANTLSFDGGELSIWHGPLTSPGGTPTLQVASPGASTFLCHSLALGGDVDGDGYPDLAISSDAADPPRAVVLSGAGAGIHSTPDVALMAVTGPAGASLFGDTLALGADLLGDATPDLAVGRPQFGVYFYDGTNSTDVSYTAADATIDRNNSSHFARALWSGDFDGDGVDEVLMGAPGDDVAGADAGAVYALQGPLAGAIDLDADADWVVRGQASQDAIGYQLEVGDLTGDGANDLVIAAPQYLGGASVQGRVHLVPGPLGAGEHVVSDVQTATMVGIPEPIVTFGIELAALGDVDGDGVPDLAVGDPYWSDYVHRGGAVHVFHGPVQGDVDVYDASASRLLGHESAALFGSAIAATGDLDADGYADFAAAAPFWDTPSSTSGGIWLVYGQGL